MSDTDVSAESPLKVGDRVLDRYVVIERFETGGTSVVYRGDDERLSRPVCIKVFNTVRDKEWLYQTSYQHFVQEAFALSRLTHPNTLRIYDFGHLPDPRGGTDGLPFQVSEFMNGGTLSHLVRREGPLRLAEAHSVVSAICGALDEAHHVDIVHRDIKPKNILFGTTGQTRQPKLADFGIAKSVGIDPAALKNRAGDTQVVAGRRLLMFSGLWASPEQLAAQPVSPATDLYSWALVTIYMITGRSVFSASQPAEAYKERKDSDRLIDRALEKVTFPPAVVELFKQTCSFEPDKRPSSAGVFAQALADAFGKKPIRRLALPSPDSQTTSERDIERVRRPSSVPPVAQDNRVVPVEVERPVARGPLTPITPSSEPQRFGDRAGSFVAMSDGSGDVAWQGGRARLRVSVVPTSAPEPSIHVRGLNCFVRKVGGRASGATQLDHSGAVEILLPNQQLLATAHVVFGSLSNGYYVMPVGDESLALAQTDARLAVALDFGAGGECVVLYDPTAAAHAARKRL